jgi:DNA-3-methyladenine glycosylase
MTEKLPRSFYQQDTITVARSLLGCVLWRRLGRELLAARLVEVEAYLGANDSASHARRGPRSPRNESMYLEGGHVYVYFTYGMHWCMNTVCEGEGHASAVLLRAGEVVAGEAEAVVRRPGVRGVDRARGPARLARLLGISGEQNGLDLTLGGSVLTLLPGAPVADDNVRVGPRVGLNPRLGEAAEWPWRWWIADSPAVSTFRPGGLRVRKARSDG